ncbi:MAG: hypothetical protein DHS20C13_08970 [Thermodesulfobacteriota bacterium]|nr:MAG: hypothetical protein DHS20C13_08970 [Thermodesulfobacteriota bacterium]
MLKRIGVSIITLAISFLIIGGCSSSNNGGGGSCPDTNLSIAVCDPSAGPFSLIINNPFFPLFVGDELVLEGEDDEGTFLEIIITVLDETEVIAGVTTRVVEEAEFEDGEVVEISRNFFAQAPDGTVCYFGEDVDDFEDGMIVGHDGEWRAGENGNLPGIIMPANPQVGQVFQQEAAPGIAEDQAEIVAFGETIDVPAGMFSDTLTSLDCNPNENGATDEKVYIRNIGLAIDEDAELVSF